MGFMAGFGTAFSRSFEGARDRAAQERQDVFRLTYQDFMQRQQQYDEWNREDSKLVNKAQEYARVNNLPEGAWTQVYSWLKSDFKDDDIQKMITRGAWEVDENTPVVDKVEQPTGVDAEMSAAGMTQGPAPMEQPQEPEQRDTGLFGNLLGNLAQKGKRRTADSMTAKRRGMALEKIAAQTGRPIEEVQGVMAGYKAPQVPESNVKYVPGAAPREPDAFSNPNDAYIELAQAEDAFMKAQTPENQERYRQAKIRVKGLQDKTFMEAEAKALAEGVSANGAQVTLWESGEYAGSGRLIKNQDGSSAVMIPGQGMRPLKEGETPLPMTKEELDLRKELNSQIAKEREELDTKRENSRAMFHHLNVMNETIRNTNGEVLKAGTATITSKVEKWAVDIATGANKISQAFAENGAKGLPDGGYGQLLAAEQALLSADKNDLGSQKLLFDTQKALLAYRIGMSMGQEGRGLAEAERKLFMDTAASGWTVDQFYDGMANLVMPIVKSVDSQGSNIYSKAAKRFEGQYDYVPGEFEYTPLMTELSKNSDSAPLFQEFSKRDRSGPAQIIPTGSTGDPLPKNTDLEQPAQQVPAPKSKQEYDAIPSGTEYRHPDGTIRTKK